MSIKKACGALGVSRGGYYAFLNRPKSSRQIAREALEPFVEDIFYANNRRYGSRRIVVELRKIGIVANGKTVQRMMARKGLVSCRAPRSTEEAERPQTRGQCLEQGILRPKEEQRVVRRHHLHTHGGRMALPDHLPRPVLSQDSRMASVPPHQRESGNRRP